MSIALLGVPVDFEFRGKLFKVAPRDLFIKISFADWCGIDAGLTLSRYRPHWPADFYDAQMRLLNSKIIGKQLRWGSEEVFNASWSEEGIRQLLYLKMMRGAEKGGARPERELLDDIAEDKAKYEELQAIMQRQDYADFFDAANPPASPDNQLAPAPAITAGQPSDLTPTA